MKRITTLFCLMATLLMCGQKNYANDYCEPCFNWCTDLSYAIGADYLYWTVTRPEDNAIATGFPLSSNAFLQPQYQSGYRVAAAIYYNCVDFEARYTSLHSNNFLNSPVVDLTSPITGLNYELDYHVVDLAFGYTRYFQCHRGYLKPYVGTKLAWLKDDTTAFYTPVRNATLTTHAYGPMLGIEGSWELFRCWIPVSLVARGDVSVLYGSFEYSGSLAGADILTNKAFSFVSVEDLYIGLGFDLCSFSCFDANFQIGYEAQLWSGIRTYSENTLGGLVPRNLYSGLGLGGLVAHFGLMF